MEVEQETEQKLKEELTKEVKRSERKLKELGQTVEDEKKTHVRLQTLIEQLQNKIGTYKKQVEETEEVAAINLAKFRKVHSELADALDRADLAENQLGKIRAKSRTSVSMTRSSSPQVNRRFFGEKILNSFIDEIINARANRRRRGLPRCGPIR